MPPAQPPPPENYRVVGDDAGGWVRQPSDQWEVDVDPADDDVIAWICCDNVIVDCGRVEDAESEVDVSPVGRTFVAAERRRRDEVQHAGWLVTRNLHH